MLDINPVIEHLLKANELETYQGPVSEKDIYKLIVDTNCTLCADYLTFLRRCGFASWDGHSVFGIYDVNDSRFPRSYCFSASQQTLKARNLNINKPYPHMDDSIVIGTDSMSGYFLLLSESTTQDRGVRWISFDEDWTTTKAWESFASYLEYLLEQ